MTPPDLAPLLEPIDDTRPCGRDLELTLELQALERLAQEPHEAAIAGLEVVDERNWRAIATEARALLRSSKDLRVAVLLTRALSHTGGVVGFCHGVCLIADLVSRYWDGLYPACDEDDGNADLRLNTLRELYSNTQLKVLRQTTFVSSQALGTFSANDVLVALGNPQGRTTSERDGPAAAHVMQCLEQLDQDTFEGLHQALAQARTALAELGAFLSKTLGQHYFAPALLTAPVGERTAGLLDSLFATLEESSTRRHPKVRGAVGSSQELSSDETSDGARDHREDAGRSTAGARIDGEVHSRDDVLRAIDSICRYYGVHEPGSPVPLLMTRAKRLVFMSFMELVEELADQGLPQIALLAGNKPTE